MSRYSVLMTCQMSIAAEVELDADSEAEAREKAVGFALANGYVGDVSIATEEDDGTYDASLAEGSVEDASVTSVIDMDSGEQLWEEDDS